MVRKKIPAATRPNKHVTTKRIELQPPTRASPLFPLFSVGAAEKRLESAPFPGKDYFGREKRD